jgi:hypothetical protein
VVCHRALRETNLNPFGLSLSKPCLSSKKKDSPLDAARGVARDRLRQAQGERGER